MVLSNDHTTGLELLKVGSLDYRFLNVDRKILKFGHRIDQTLTQ